MPTKALLHGPLTEEGQQIADKIRKKLDGHPTLFEPSIRRNPKMPDPRMAEQTVTARYGMSWNRRGELWLIPWRPPSRSPKPRPPRDTIEKFVACAALGLSYWCDAPSDRMGRGRVTGTFIWATDGHSMHLVNVKPKLGLVVAACTPYSRLPHAAQRCEYKGESSVYTVPADDSALWELPEPDPAVVATIGNQSLVRSPDTEPDLSITREVLQSAVAHIRHDNSYVTDTETAVLVKLRATRGTSFARDIMPLIIAELERRAAA
ncbi:DUF7457 domain-containing protein [Mycobacteroides abscessus]|uniref:DUF7457 domain-containing protein n=1 Tax=Mycobacteroides abscessus TaxID=36809 RepID=UPI0009A7EB11|nr:hypothetical protein [Mycobacteroides abscessus]SLF56601.1 Uncharacterised protein [Mycobacteroides abscessus subsp. bolletii]